MTRYTVVWHQMAQDRLALLWLSAEDRSQVSAAANAIDQELAEDPTTRGVEVSPGLFELTALPLRVLFQVSEPDRLVKSRWR
jgi:hypothetical protein